MRKQLSLLFEISKAVTTFVVRGVRGSNPRVIRKADFTKFKRVFVVRGHAMRASGSLRRMRVREGEFRGSELLEQMLGVNPARNKLRVLT